ncbi:hypothetical protein G6L46_10375 [Agrobacterium rhizogenes]|uniref:hypothetical protein n=1 Tax=Rhizobium rhizogenes TaxID=359 RepID=UPI0015729E85|nr:hypothetical protein [Rhizobium rhizogenes]NTF87529.1 hypothetical protein [Rhizobium rhizogenes]
MRIDGEDNELGDCHDLLVWSFAVHIDDEDHLAFGIDERAAFLAIVAERQLNIVQAHREDVRQR